MQQGLTIAVARLAAVGVLAASIGCESVEPNSDRTAEVSLDVPAGFESIPVPELNPMTAGKVELGERLFFDTILSRDQSLSCSSCHDPLHAFADPRRLSVGVDGRLGIRNSPTLVNVAYQRLLFWDGGSLTLEHQVLGPLEEPREMDANIDDILERLNSDATYAAQFDDVFGQPAGIATLTQALASYERTIRTGASRFDRHRDGDTTALSQSERRGFELFSGRAECTECHSGVLLTNQRFEDNGIGIAADDSGRARITLSADDFGKFKVPTLRNVALTAPYMHDGRFRSLEEVITHYDTGGTGSDLQHESIRPLHLTDQERSDLIAFLHALTDDYIMAGSERIDQTE